MPIGAGKSARDQVSTEEWQLHCELATAHRLVAHFVFVDMTYNLISARAPEEPNHFLVKLGTAYMEQVTASNLVKCDVYGISRIQELVNKNNRFKTLNCQAIGTARGMFLTPGNKVHIELDCVGSRYIGKSGGTRQLINF